MTTMDLSLDELIAREKPERGRQFPTTQQNNDFQSSPFRKNRPYRQWRDHDNHYHPLDSLRRTRKDISKDRSNRENDFFKRFVDKRWGGNQNRNYGSITSPENKGISTRGYATTPWDERPSSSSVSTPGSRVARYLRTLLISGLEYSVLQEDLDELFSAVGKVERCWVDFDRTNRSIGTGGVIFEHISDAEHAKDLFDGRAIDGSPIFLQFKSETGGDKSKRRVTMVRDGDSSSGRRGRK